MIDVDAWLTDTGLDAKMIMQVHDELVFEVADDACETLCDNVTQRMANVIELQVPLLTEVGVGDNWDEAH
jgi:DNA polymerase-1